MMQEEDDFASNGRPYHRFRDITILPSPRLPLGGGPLYIESARWVWALKSVQGSQNPDLLNLVRDHTSMKMVLTQSKIRSYSMFAIRLLGLGKL